jgi:HAE1 family hydrophobic/amphiphilic exporter-1
VILKDWSVRGKDESVRAILEHIYRESQKLTDAVAVPLVPPPIQGIGAAGGFTMMVEQRDGTFDYNKQLNSVTAIIDAAKTQTGLARLVTSFRANVPQLEVIVDRVKAEALHVGVGDVFSALSSYTGSTYVNQINKFGHVFQVYVQAESKYRLQPRDIELLNVRNTDKQMIPLGALATVRPVTGPALISLYNLYLAATIRRRRSATRSSTRSGWAFCWCICAWPGSTKAGSRRCR